MYNQWDWNFAKSCQIRAISSSLLYLLNSVRFFVHGENCDRALIMIIRN
jgi:hypothetical protein